jgi:hypothetical protein
MEFCRIDPLQSPRRVVHVLAADEGDGLAFEQPRDGAGHARTLHLALKLVQENPQELLKGQGVHKSGVNVMITIFCDFCQFSAKKLAFFSKTNVMIKF